MNKQTYSKRLLTCLSPDDKHRLEMIANFKKTSMSQLIREAITYMLLNVWLKGEKNE